MASDPEVLLPKNVVATLAKEVDAILDGEKSFSFVEVTLVGGAGVSAISVLLMTPEVHAFLNRWAVREMGNLPKFLP